MRVYNRDTIIGKIDSNKNVVVDANFLNDVKLQIVKYTSAEDYVNADKFIELQDELSAIQGSMSKGGGIFCKNK